MIENRDDMIRSLLAINSHVTVESATADSESVERAMRYVKRTLIATLVTILVFVYMVLVGALTTRLSEFNDIEVPSWVVQFFIQISIWLLAYSWAVAAIDRPSPASKRAICALVAALWVLGTELGLRSGAELIRGDGYLWISPISIWILAYLWTATRPTRAVRP